MGCDDRDTDEVLSLRLHGSVGCELPEALRRQNLELLALGDFEAGNESAEILPLASRGAALSFPAATRAVSARVGTDNAFWGYGERRSRDGVDLLLWPEGAACALFRPDGAQGYPGRHGGQAFAFDAARGLVVAAGGNDALVTDAIVGTLTFDAARGSVSASDTSEPGVLREPRAFASMTAFGDALLVAGGETPVFGVPATDLEPLATAEIFDAALGRVTGDRIELRSRRTHHAAVVLDDGRTLLVGGRSQTADNNIAQYQLEIIDPKTRHADAAHSITGRIDPTALRLSDGRIFVGGGVDAQGALVQPVAEWLSPSAVPERTELDAAVGPRFERAFVATLGGGVLAVGGCVDREPDSSEEDCRQRCERGCPPRGENYDAWWISRDGVATRVDLSGISAPRPILMAGTDASPWLVAATAREPEIPRLFRFDPWHAAFTLAELEPDTRLPRPGFPAPLAVDADAFVWLDDDEQHGELLGLRLGVRGRYAQDVALVLQSDPLDTTKALHLAPDGPLGESVRYGAGALELRSPDVTVHVTDTDYLDVTVTLHVAGDELPIVLLGSTELGGKECPWPNGRVGGPEWPQIVRRGTRAELRVGAARSACEVAKGRSSLSLRAGKLPSTVTTLEVKR